MRYLSIIFLCVCAWAQSHISGNTTITGKSTMQTAAPAPITISTVTPPVGTVSTNYSFLVPVSGGTPPYSCVNSGTLPSGITLAPATANQGCLYSGLLSVGSGGTYPGITVTATDSFGAHATSSPPYTITIIFPQALGPPRYLGAIQSLAPIQLPTTLPVMGPNACPGNPLPCYTLGVGTVISDPSFNPAVPTIVIRGTDGNVECGSRNGFSFFEDVGGSGDANSISKNGSHFTINDNGNAYLMMNFNPLTYAVSQMYPSIYGCPSGRGTFNVPAGEWSFTNDNIYYGIQSATSCQATSCPNDTSISEIDVSSPVAPTFKAVFDFKNCLPAGSPVTSWTSQGGVDVTDRYFAQAVSITGGGQNTGSDAMFYDRTNQACFLYDTIGNVDPGRTAIALNGATAVYTKTTKQVVITATNTFTSGQYLYMIGLTGNFSPLNGYVLLLTGTSTSTITGTLTANLGHADISGAMVGPACVGLPTVQCANIGTIRPAVYKFTGSSCSGTPVACSVWTKSTVGYVDPAVGSFTVHNDKISKNGSFLVVAGEVCVTVCTYNFQIQYWVPQAVTPTVYLYNNNGGHWSEGYNVWFNEGGSSRPYFAWTGFPVSSPPIPVPPNTNPNFCTSAGPNPGAAQCLIFPIPPTCNAGFLPNPCIKSYDSHPNWNTNNPTFQALWGMAQDTTPISTSIYSNAWVYGTPFFGPWINEVVILNACVFNAVLPATCNALGNTVLREGHTYNTGLSLLFDTTFQVGTGDPQGKFYFFSTDHGGQFGQRPSFGTFANVTSTSISSLVGTFTYANPTITGNVNTSSTGNTVTWVSGSKFGLGWTGTITINAVSYTIASVVDVTHITLTTDPGNQTNKAYSFPPTNPIITAGMQVALWGFQGTLTGLNGTYVTASATGLTPTQFRATLPVGTADSGPVSSNTATATKVTCSTADFTGCRGDIEIIVLQ